MLRIGRLTDYGIDLLTLFVDEQLSFGLHGASAAQLARQSGVPLPTVSKICKMLARAGLLVGSRGSAGGYRLARDASDITVADVVRVLEGPIALTACLAEPTSCSLESTCGTRTNWERINQHVLHSLETVTIAEMSAPRHGAAPVKAVRPTRSKKMAHV